MSEELIRGTAGPGVLDDLHAALARLFAGSAVPAEARLTFSTAVAEVAANVVEHACAGLPDAAVSIRLKAAVDRLDAWLEDGGRALGGPLRIPPPPDDLAERGRGLGIAAEAVDELEYEHSAGVNHWHLQKRLPA